MSISKVVQAIISLNPQAAFNTGDGNDLDTCTITWHDGTPEISKADIQAEMDRLQAEYDAQEYARKRKAEYPTIEDQLDKIYHDGIDSWKEEMILPVKNKFPKT
jgi:hypothetical protein